jgi:hypothetical protein
VIRKIYKDLTRIKYLIFNKHLLDKFGINEKNNIFCIPLPPKMFFRTQIPKISTVKKK